MGLGAKSIMNRKLLLLIFVPLILCATLSLPNPVYGNSATITPVDDGYVYDLDKDKNMHYDPEWFSLYACVTPVRYRIWLKFSIPSQYTTITKAIVYLYQDGFLDGNPVVTLHYSGDNSWNEETLTWNNQPSFGSSLDSKIIGYDKRWYGWDVSSIISGSGTFSFCLKTDTNATLDRFNAKESDSNRPYLYIEYSGGDGGEANGSPNLSQDKVVFSEFATRLGLALGIGEFAGGLLATSLVMALFLFPTLILVKGKANQLYAILFVGFSVMGVCVTIGWLPYWIFLIIILIIASTWRLKKE
jgi:hypothetical protein